MNVSRRFIFARFAFFRLCLVACATFAIGLVSPSLVVAASGQTDADSATSAAGTSSPAAAPVTTVHVVTAPTVLAPTVAKPTVVKRAAVPTAASVPAVTNKAAGQSLRPIRQWLRTDSDTKLLQAALVANGVSATNRGRMIAKLEKQTEQLVAQARLSVQQGKASAAASDLLKWLHANLLTGKYYPQCARLDATLEDGTYNCVTATILYQWLCERSGIEAHVIAVPSHVFHRIHATRERVETTCSTWFELSPSQRRPAAKPERELTPQQLVAKLFYNRAVSLLAKNEFSAATQALRNSLLLDPHDEAAKENLLAAYNNWALFLADRQDYQQAARLLKIGRSLNPQYSAFHANTLHVYQKWVVQLCNNGQHQRALQLLEERRPEFPSDALFDEGRLSVYRLWIVATLHKGDIGAAIKLQRQFVAAFAEHKSFDSYHRDTQRQAEQTLRTRGDNPAQQRWQAAQRQFKIG